MCVHRKGISEYLCMQCMSRGNSFGEQLTVAQLLVKNIEKRSAWKKEVLAAREMVKEIKPDLDGTDVKVRLMQWK